MEGFVEMVNDCLIEALDETAKALYTLWGLRFFVMNDLLLDLISHHGSIIEYGGANEMIQLYVGYS